jgi:Cu+-exporting ATPase
VSGTLASSVLRPPAGALQATGLDLAVCFHCGLPCGSTPIVEEGKRFCCHGCATVHGLLNASGLGRFYELNAHPGSKINSPAAREQWAFLDAPEVQGPLLDFTDGRTSRVTFHIPAIHCVACVWLLENLFRLHPGIGGSRVNFGRREVAIAFAPDQIALSELVALLASIGYAPRLTLGGLDKDRTDPARRRLQLQVGVAGFAFGNIMLFALPTYFGLDSLSGPMFQHLFGYLSLALALPVLLFSAADYFRSAWLSARQRVLTLDVPIALGLAAIYGQSAFEILAGRGLGYCDSMTGLVFFLLCGKIFQQKTYERLAFDRDYRSFFPLSVTRVRRGVAEAWRDGEPLRPPNNPAPPHSLLEERVSLSQLQVGDRLRLRNSELIPADSRLVHGPAFIDYSFVTGEAEPVAKQEGDYVYAGGRQVGGTIEVETVKPVSQSYLTSLWNHEAFQKSGHDDLNTLTNRYSRRFTALVVLVALGAGLGWMLAGQGPRGVKAFVSVLIVACPCALALAAPFTLGTAQRLLGRRKIFVKNTHVLERLAHVDSVVLDKTGTLTTAGVGGVSFQRSQETPAQRVAPRLSEFEEGLVFSLSRHSTHPQAVRLSDSLAGRCFPEPVRGFLETAGCGIEGSVQGHEVWLGARAWLAARGAECEVARPDGTGAEGSEVWVAVDGRCLGVFTLASSVRPGVAELAGRLANPAGRCELTLLSGDNDRDRDRFRALLGAQAQLHFNQSPLDKLNHVRHLQQSGRNVMMVGDGLNDAGALKQSDVGVAVVEQAGAFSPASDLILEAPQVPRLADLLAFSRVTTRLVRLGFLISAGYNVAGIAIAASGMLSPLVCAVLMPISSASVVAFATGGAHWAAKRTGFWQDDVPR